MTRRLTTETFVAAAKARHGDICDYSTFVYPANGSIKAEFLCRTHGSFLQRPSGHLVYSGCPKCGRQRDSYPGLEVGRFHSPKGPLTAERLRELVHYDLETGVFTRRIKTAGRVKVGDVCGSLNGKGYLQFSVDSKNYRNNRLAVLWVTGRWPAGEVDHKDQDKTNNRWDNLRDVDHFVNMQNQKNPHITNRAGLIGAHLSGGKFRSQITVNGVREYLGEFDSKEAANAAYMARKRATPGSVL